MILSDSFTVYSIIQDTHSLVMQNYLQEIEQALKPLVKNDPDYKRFRELCTHYSCFGIRLPQLRSLFKKGFSFSHLSHEEQVPLWNSIWKQSKQHESMTLPLFYFEARKRKNNLSDWKLLKTWIEQIDGWEHGDRLAGIYAHLFERYPEKIYPTLVKWQSSKNPWKRRNAILTLIYYASPKRSYPSVEKILPLLKPLLSDKNPYVQKAVGWTLRECGTLYPKPTFAFLLFHIQELSATAYSYATERLTFLEKQHLQTKRKEKSSTG